MGYDIGFFTYPVLVRRLNERCVIMMKLVSLWWKHSWQLMQSPRSDSERRNLGA